MLKKTDTHLENDVPANNPILETKELNKSEEKTEVLEKKEPNKTQTNDELHAPMAIQYVNFNYDLDKTSSSPEVKEMFSKLTEEFAQSVEQVFQVTLPLSDSQVVGINLQVPEMRITYDKGMKISGHKDIKTPLGLTVDIDHYHADGAEADTERLKEQDKLAQRNSHWIEQQLQKKNVTGNGRGDLLTIGDFNVSAVIWNDKTKKLEWNIKFIEMLEKAFPQGIYGLSIPKNVKLKKRGEDDGISVANNQTAKNELEVYCVKTIQVHTRTDVNGKAISKVNVRDLLNTDPNKIFTSIKNFKNTDSVLDHPKSNYIIGGLRVVTGANMGLLGFKAFAHPTAKYTVDALRENGSIKTETYTTSKICFTKLATILNANLGMNIKLDLSKYIGSSFAKSFNKIITAMITADKATDNKTLRSSLISSIHQWVSSKEFKDLAVLSLKPPKVFLPDGSVADKAIEEIVDKFLQNKKPQFDLISTKVFDLETSGGFIFNEKLEGLDNHGVNKRQAHALAKSVKHAMAEDKKSTFVLGGDPQDTLTVMAVYDFKSESSEFYPVMCNKILDIKLPSEISPSEYVKQQVLKETNRVEHDFLQFFNNEIYYVNTLSNGTVRHIPLPENEDANKVYEDLKKKFETAKGAFTLHYSKDGNILDLLFDNGIALKGSKDTDYHNLIRQEFKIPALSANATKLAIFGLFPQAPQVKAEESPHYALAATLD